MLRRVILAGGMLLGGKGIRVKDFLELRWGRIQEAGIQEFRKPERARVGFVWFFVNAQAARVRLVLRLGVRVALGGRQVGAIAVRRGIRTPAAVPPGESWW